MGSTVSIEFNEDSIQIVYRKENNMAANIHLNQIDTSANYTVSLINHWDGGCNTETMDGESLYYLIRGCAHIYDIHAELATDDEPEEEEEEEEEQEQPRDAETIIADIVNYLEENTDVANSLIEELDSCNGYLGDDRCYPMDELPELMNGTDTFDLLRMAYFGHDGEAWHLNQYGDKVWESSFNPNRDYFGFNGYGNLMSYDEPDYSDYIDKHLVRELSDNRRWIDGIEDDEELAELFDELEEAIAQ